jgi:hypothetical protein
MALLGTGLVLSAAGGASAVAGERKQGQAPADAIAAGFQEVPPAARLRMFWRIFGPAWTKEEIDRQLAALQQAGVGGVMTCFTYPVAQDDPGRGIRNQHFLSPEFLDTLRHAAEQARQRGLEFGLCGGTGWPYGGPQVPLSDAAQRLRREVVVPLPDGSGYRLPPLRDGERALALFLDGRDVTDHARGGFLPCEAVNASPPGASSPALLFIAGPTYMAVKRAALGAEGYVVDHFDRRAVRRYLEAVVAPMLAAVPNGGARSLFCDSLEVYRANWTRDFPAQFRRRRGYDLVSRLPELFDDQAAACHNLRYDFWRTAAELAEEEFARTVHQWCRKRGVPFVLEPYGTPSMGLTAGRRCDVPWGEQYEWKGFSFSRFAASAGHLAGRKIIGAEAWTWAGLPNRLADSLADLKLCSDLHFLSGENELTGVDFPYSPASEGAPGWLPYYGPVMGLANPQWLCFPELAAYVGRCQWLLQQGRPVADVALYLPVEDVFAHGTPEQMLLNFQLRDRLVSGEPTDEFGLEKALRHRSDIVHAILTSGYDFDGIDFFAMNTLARVARGRAEGPRPLAAGDGRYAILLLPNLEGMDLEALEKVADFCRQGGTVIALGRLPDRVYGVGQADASRRLRARIAAMFGPADGGDAAGDEPGAVRGREYGNGQAIFLPEGSKRLGAVLAATRPGPDFLAQPRQPDVGHVHRKVGDRDFYFVANTADRPTCFTAACRVGNRAASLWDPMTGAICSLPRLPAPSGYTRVEVTLPPRGSLFLAFSPRDPRRGEGARGRESAHDTPDVSSSRPRTPRPLELDWRVTFDGPDAPPPYETRALTSWTGWPGARYFSGRATYAATFAIPPGAVPRTWLRFEQVREVAEIAVNGRRAGAVWTPPYEVEITAALLPGENRLRITVANLPVNRVLGLPGPDLAALRALYGDRFPAPEEKQLMREPAPSGLIGRVELLVQDGS